MYLLKSLFIGLWLLVFFEKKCGKLKGVKLKHSWIKRDQLDVTCFIISLFNAQHVSDVNTFILRSLRLIRSVISWVVLLWYELSCGLAGVVWYPDAGWSTTHEITQQISRKLLRMDVLTSETCWAVNNEIIKQVTCSWSLFIQLSRWCTVQ